MSENTQTELEKLLKERILVLDGAMGTTIRTYGLDEAAARGDRFKDNEKDLLNNGDILSLTQPEVIGDIHKSFYEAGSGEVVLDGEVLDLGSPADAIDAGSTLIATSRSSVVSVAR